MAYQSILQYFDAQFVQAALQTALFAATIVAIRVLGKRPDVPNSLLLAAFFTVELLILSAFGPLVTWQNATLIVVAAFTIAMYIRFEQKGPSI